MVVGVVGTNAAQPPQQASAPLVQHLGKDDVGVPPVVGTGPLERVLRVDRSGEVVGVEPFTGEKVALSADEIAGTGTAAFVIQRFGYSQAASRTISLTYDDGPDAVITPRLLDTLARHGVPATFFVLGQNVAMHPQIVARTAREGHAIGIHSLTHVQMAEAKGWRAHAELVGTDRMLRSVTGHAAGIWRMPYDSDDPLAMQDNVEALLRGQRLGYVHASYDVDTRDWMFDADAHGTASDIPLPDLSDGRNVTILMHDAGGPNRQRTIEYTELLIAHARANGYTFQTMPQVNPAVATANAPVEASVWDGATLLSAEVTLGWPELTMKSLFAMSLVLIVGVGVLNVILALRRRYQRSRIAWPHPMEMGVSTSVVLAAFNEEAVIARTLTSILDSAYPLREVIVVDDGSSDLTADVVRWVQDTKDPHGRVVLVQQQNTGKAHALNRGIARATGDVIVTLDADTIIRPDTVTNLVRHFCLDGSGRLGAVAGVVRVGNRRRNLLTRWQSLEYLTQIGLDRGAQDALGAITIIPGACAAWRKDAIVEAGGYSSATLAEDCDLALTLHQRGWRVTQDDEADAYTEAPENVDDLLKQRVRWTYGTLQAMYKNRRMVFGRGFGALGFYVLPSYLLSIVVPLVFLPFVAVMTVMTLQREPGMLLAYFGAFILVHLAFAAVAVRLMGEGWRHLLIVPVYRVVYEPLRAYLLYKSVHLAIKGGREGWNKVDRSGSMDQLAGLEIVTVAPVNAVSAVRPVSQVGLGGAARRSNPVSPLSASGPTDLSDYVRS